MSDRIQRALKTAVQSFVGTVVGLWSAAAVFSTEGAVDISALKKFGVAVLASLIATGLSLLMSVVSDSTAK